MNLKKIHLFAEYEEERKKFAADSSNMALFEVIAEKAECLKSLEDLFRFLELTLYEVQQKKDNGLRRLDGSYALWVEEQRSKLFEGNTIKVLTFLLSFFIEDFGRSNFKIAFDAKRWIVDALLPGQRLTGGEVRTTYELLRFCGAFQSNSI